MNAKIYSVLLTIKREKCFPFNEAFYFILFKRTLRVYVLQSTYTYNNLVVRVEFNINDIWTASTQFKNVHNAFM